MLLKKFFIWYKILAVLLKKEGIKMDKHKIITKIVAIVMIAAMLLATASTLIYYLLMK